MTKWAPCVGVAVWACVALSVPGTAAESGPKLTVSEAEHDLGRLERVPAKRSAQTLLRNTGSAVLSLRKVRTSCLCLTAVPSSTMIGPGDEATLRLELDPMRVEEVFTEEVLIYSNDGNAPLQKVRVSGAISSPVRIEPLAIPVGISYRGDLPRVPFPSVQVMSADGAPLGEVRATASSPSIHPQIRKLEDGSYEVGMTVDESMKLGDVNEYIKLETTHPRVPIVKVPVMGAVVGELTPVGRLVDFGFIPEEKAAEATLRLPKRGNRDIKVLKAEVNLPIPAEVDAQMNPEGTHLVIKVRVVSPPAFTLLRGKVEVLTDNPAEARIHVQVAGGVFGKRPFGDGPHGEPHPALLKLVMAALARGENYPETRFYADILGGVEDDRASKVLIRALDEGDLPTRMRAAELLAAYKTAEVLERLRLTITEDSEEFVRRNALVGYAEGVGTAAIPELLLALRDDYGWVREDAAIYLGKLGDERVIPALRAALADPDPDANTAIRSALAAVQARAK